MQAFRLYYAYRIMRTLILTLLFTILAAPLAAQTRPRTTDLGLRTGRLTPGPLNAITDVAGVRVGHATLIRGADIRTGVTAILPHPRNLFRKSGGRGIYWQRLWQAGWIDASQRAGEIETPILLLASTFPRGRCRDRRSGCRQ